MDFLKDFSCGLLMLFIAFMVFDWGRIWWYARRHGYIKLPTHVNELARPTRWEREYLGYKIWTWTIRVMAWIIAAWHLCLALLWFIDLAFAVSVS